MDQKYVSHTRLLRNLVPQLTTFGLRFPQKKTRQGGHLYGCFVQYQTLRPGFYHNHPVTSSGKATPGTDSRIRHRIQIDMFRSIRVDHTNCLQVAIKTHSSLEYLDRQIDISIHEKDKNKDEKKYHKFMKWLREVPVGSRGFKVADYLKLRSIYNRGNIEDLLHNF